MWGSTSSAMPMPVSVTAISTRAVAPARVPRTETVTEPSSVNLTALPTRFIAACRMRPASPEKPRGRSGA